MRSIHIKASREYDVLVERGLLDRAGELLREVSAPGMAAIVSDDTVYALYGERTVKALEKAGYRVHSFTFPAGEGSKNLSTYADVLHFLGEHRFSRSDVVVALGGGVVGDLAGFAAATYQRGMGSAHGQESGGQLLSALHRDLRSQHARNAARGAVPLRLRRDHQVFDARQCGVL